MEEKTNYGLIFISAFGISYLIIALLRFFGYVYNGKIFLLCSMCSASFAIISILESVVSYLKKSETVVLNKLHHFESCEQESYSPQVEYADTEKQNQSDGIHKEYIRRINKLHHLKSGLAFTTVFIFFLFLSTNFVEENSILADTLSLISFALIFIDIAIKHYMQYIVERFVKNFNTKNGG